MDKQVVISIKTVFLTLLMLLGGYVLYRSGPIIGILFVSTLIVISIEPIVKGLMNINFLNKPLPRGLAVVLAYASLIVFISVTATAWLPVVFSQSQKLILYLVNLLGKYELPQNLELSLTELLPQISKISGGFLAAITGSFRVVASIFSVLIVSIYMSTDWENIKRRLAAFFSERGAESFLGAMEEIEVEINHWVKGQLFLMFAIGLLSYIGLVLIDVDYPLALALFSGLFEIIPFFGPFIAAVLAAVVGGMASPTKGLAIVAFYTVIQQLENNVLVPQVMKRVSGFSPLLILIALLVASEFFGILGAVLALPVTMVGTIILKRVLQYRD